MTGIGKIYPLITNLKFEPTAMEYCFKEKVLYICAGPNSGELSGQKIAYKLQILEVGEQKVKIEPPGTQYVIKPTTG